MDAKPFRQFLAFYVPQKMDKFTHSPTMLHPVPRKLGKIIHPPAMLYSVLKKGHQLPHLDYISKVTNKSYHH